MMEKVKEPGHTMSRNAGSHNTCNRTACKAYQSTPSPHPRLNPYPTPTLQAISQQPIMISIYASSSDLQYYSGELKGEGV